MARNEEKAQSMLYRFREAMLVEAGVKRHPKDKSSLVPATTNSIPIAEQGRRDVLKEIYRKIGRIQDKELEVVIVRTLNDEINEAIEQVKLWDERIRELGGLTKRSQRRIEEFEAAAVSADGKSAASATSSDLVQINGKYYFGRARELPEVQDYQKQRLDIDKESSELRNLRKQRNELYAQVDHRYYGHLPNDLEELICKEESTSNKEIYNLDWITNQPMRITKSSKEEHDARQEETISDLDLLAQKEGFHVPNQEVVQEYLLERRKQDLLNKYT